MQLDDLPLSPRVRPERRQIRSLNMSTDSSSAADFPSTIAEQEGDEVVPVKSAGDGPTAARASLAEEDEKEELDDDDHASDGGKQDDVQEEDEGDITMRLKGDMASEFSQPDDEGATSEDNGHASDDDAAGSHGLSQGKEEGHDTTARLKRSNGDDDDYDDYRSELSEDEAVAASLAYA